MEVTSNGKDNCIIEFNTGKVVILTNLEMEELESYRNIYSPKELEEMELSQRLDNEQEEREQNDFLNDELLGDIYDLEEELKETTNNLNAYKSFVEDLAKYISLNYKDELEKR